MELTSANIYGCEEPLQLQCYGYDGGTKIKMVVTKLCE